MAIGEIHVGDVGTALEFTILDQDGAVVPIGGALELEIKFKPPGNAATFLREPELTTDGSDGKLHYVTVDGDFDRPGEWKVQAIVTLSTGVKYSDITEFPVHSNL